MACRPTNRWRSAVPVAAGRSARARRPWSRARGRGQLALRRSGLDLTLERRPALGRRDLRDVDAEQLCDRGRGVVAARRARVHQARPVAGDRRRAASADPADWIGRARPGSGPGSGWRLRVLPGRVRTQARTAPARTRRVREVPDQPRAPAAAPLPESVPRAGDHTHVQLLRTKNWTYVGPRPCPGAQDDTARGRPGVAASASSGSIGCATAAGRRDIASAHSAPSAENPAATISAD